MAFTEAEESRKGDEDALQKLSEELIDAERALEKAKEVFKSQKEKWDYWDKMVQCKTHFLATVLFAFFASKWCKICIFSTFKLSKI